MRNVHRNNNGYYCIKKCFNYKTINYASFRDKETAQRYRDYCESHDWDILCKKRHNDALEYKSPMEEKEGVWIR